MALSSDWKEFLELLNARGVEYVVVGAHCLAFHGRPPNRIDLLTSLTGVTNDEAFAGKIAADLDGVPVFVLGKKELIQNKRAVGRPHDLADVAELE